MLVLRRRRRARRAACSSSPRASDEGVSASTRCFDTPLSEDGIVGTAIGMAMNGLKARRRDPVPGLHLPGLRPDRQRRRPSCATAPAASTPRRWSSARPTAAASAAGCTTASPVKRTSAHTPGLKVVIPSTPHDAKGLLIASIEDPDPGPLPGAEGPLSLGEGRRAGGPLHRRPVDAAHARATARTSPSSATARWSPSHDEGGTRRPPRTALTATSSTSARLLPLDEEGVLEAAKKTGRVVVGARGPALLRVTAPSSPR